MSLQSYVIHAASADTFQQPRTRILSAGDSFINHHLGGFLGTASVAWAGHLVHVALPYLQHPCLRMYLPDPACLPSLPSRIQFTVLATSILPQVVICPFLTLLVYTARPVLVPSFTRDVSPNGDLSSALLNGPYSNVAWMTP